MRLRLLNFAVFIMLLCLWPLSAHAVSCTTQSEMTPAQRSVYEQAARSQGTEIAAENTGALRAQTITAVAANFGPLAATIEQVAPLIRNATLTVDNLYHLNATDLPARAEQAQFFCGLSGSSLLVTVTIPQLPPGNYLLAILHATGVEQPQQLALILQNDPAGSAQWKLAGLFVRPLTVAGHPGIWYWRHARAYAGQKQNADAYFYYQTAQFLLNPVDFLSSPNLERLQKEMRAVRPADIPGKNPLVLSVNGLNLEITSMRTDAFQDGLDLVVNYKSQDVSGPVATREQILSLMKALLTRYPELRAGFHGLWVYAYSGNGQPFAIEQPMNQIQ